MGFLPQAMTWPGRVVSGRGALERLAEEAAPFGNRGLVVHGRSLGRSGRLQALEAWARGSMKLSFSEHDGGEPTVNQVEALRASSRRLQPDWMAAVGGGSVIDLCKACAVLLAGSAPVRDYHRGQDLPLRALPLLAAPAVPGSGAEATGVSVLIDPETRQKKAIRSPAMFPRAVFLDPSLLETCPRQVLAHSGLDGLTQAVESFFSQGATPFTEDLALRGLRLFADSLPAAVLGSCGPEAAGNLQAASLLTAMAFSASRLGVVHGLAHPLGARFGLAHGLLCGLCLPLALEFNREAVPVKYAQLEDILAQDPVVYARGLLESLGLANPLRGRSIPDPEAVAAETLASGSTAHNPRPVTEADVAWFLTRLTGEDRPERQRQAG